MPLERTALVDAEATVREIAAIQNAPMDILQAPKAVIALRRRQAERPRRSSRYVEALSRPGR